MPKAVPPSDFTTDDATFATNAMPDPFDDRDLPYRPKLEPLPSFIDPPVGVRRYVLTQEGDSCTGHALATTINAALAATHEKRPSNGKSAKGARTAPARVSAYMLYHFARRYDEFPGEADTGSSLRATIKGWFYHGVCTEDFWPSEKKRPKDIYDRDFVRNCRERPLGAFYRVNCYRLDDMQSAISELHAVVASAQIHGGWRHPQPYTKNGQTYYVIGSRNAEAEPTGHAFAIVGYNEIGFVIQNSWGPKWGAGGFAVLTYEDWLDSAYDAWVLRHGVPSTPFVSGRRRDEEATNSILATGVGPNRRRLDRHVISLAGDGQLASQGDFVSTEQQLDRIFACMQEWHDGWSEARPGGVGPESRAERHIVVYAQDGLRPKLASLEAADRPLNWWLNNRLYPIYLSWESGPAETLLEDLEQRMRPSLPPGGAGFDLVEQCDRLVELTARRIRRWMWEQLKQNARAAGGTSARPNGASGAGQLAARLADYVGRHEGECAVHLVGHSAGAIVLAELLPLLQGRGVPVASLVLLAPAIRVDEFENRLLAPLPPQSIRRFALFGLSEEGELNDTCRGDHLDFYQKSLLYLVSRGLEDRDPRTPGAAEIPLLGMAKYFKKPGLQARIGQKFRATVFATAPTTEDPGASTEAEHHRDFEEDAATMTSVVTQLLQGAPVDPFRVNVPLRGFDHVPGEPTSTTTPMVVADTQPPGQPPVQSVKEGQPHEPRLPPCAAGGDSRAGGAAAAPCGDRTTIGLAMAGWEPATAKRHTGPTRRRNHA